jgi:glutathione S-transferase
MSWIVKAVSDALPKQPVLRWAAIAAGAGVSYLAGRWALSAIVAARRNAVAKARRAQQKKDVVYLFSFPRMDKIGGVIPSTPCAIVELFLKSKGIAYEFIGTMDADISDNGRLPMVELNGEQLHDSRGIMDELEQRFRVADNLDREAEATTALLAETAFACNFHHYRSTLIDNFEALMTVYRAVVPAELPIVALNFMMSMSRRKQIDAYNGISYGDVPDAQYNKLFLEDVKAIEFHLSKRNYLVSGDKPTKADFIIAPELRMIALLKPLGGLVPAFAFVQTSPVIAAYLTRVFGDNAVPEIPLAK